METGTIERFAPTVVVDGRTVQPAGWMWVLGFALGGSEWAIKECDTPEFKARVRASLEEQRAEQIEKQIQHLEDQITALKVKLRM